MYAARSPLAVEPLERVRPTILECKPRRPRERSGQIGDENLVGAGSRHDPRRLVNGHPPDVLAHDLDLADVHAGPDLQARSVRNASNRRGAPQRLPGLSKVASNPSPVVFDLSPAVALELSSRSEEVIGEQGSPAGIAELGRLGRRIHEIGEEQRGEDSRPTADQEAGEERPVARPEDLDARLVADDVAVVTRWDVHDVVRPVDDLPSRPERGCRDDPRARIPRDGPDTSPRRRWGARAPTIASRARRPSDSW